MIFAVIFVIFYFFLRMNMFPMNFTEILLLLSNRDFVYQTANDITEKSQNFNLLLFTEFRFLINRYNIFLERNKKYEMRMIQRNLFSFFFFISKSFISPFTIFKISSRLISPKFRRSLIENSKYKQYKNC